MCNPFQCCNDISFPFKKKKNSKFPTIQQMEETNIYMIIMVDLFHLTIVGGLPLTFYYVTFSFCSFRHLNRAFNYAAHELASFARRNGSFQLWKGVTPPFLVSIVNADLLLYFSCFAGSSHV